MKKKYIIEGIDCANCAKDIERRISKNPYILSASLSFITNTLSVECQDDLLEDELVEIIQDASSHIVIIDKDTNQILSYMHEPHNHEHHCDSCHHEKHGHSHCHDHNDFKQNSYIIAVTRIAISIVLMAGSFFFKGQTLLNLPVDAVLLVISYLICGYDVLLKAFDKLFDEYFLMTIATIAALFLKEYFEAAAVMILYQIGETIQSIALGASRKSIRALLESKQNQIEILKDGQWTNIDKKEIRAGDTIRLKAGTVAPVDGILCGQLSAIMDTSTITGEPKPKTILPGEEVVAGYVNNNTVVEIKANTDYDKSTLSQIIEAIENATENKSKVENFTSRVAKIYTPIMTFLAFALIGYGYIIHNISQYIYIACQILIISCPCALLISIPLTFFNGIGKISNLGIIVKSANTLDAVHNAKVLAFDKTGTLTEGKFEIQAIEAIENVDSDTILKLAAYAESGSTHPIAKLILSTYTQPIDNSKIQSIQEIAGYGLKAIIDNDEILVGNNKLLEKFNVQKHSAGNIQHNFLTSSIYVVKNGTHIGTIAIGDKIKENLKFIKRLKPNGIQKTAILSGDINSITQYLREYLEIDEAYGELLPTEKAEKIKELQKNGATIFVGDGINDATALATADVGIAMGTNGTDVAVESADIVLMSDDLNKIEKLLAIAHNTHKKAIQNTTVILVSKLVIGLFSILGYSTMWQAVFADVGVLILTIINACLLDENSHKI